MDLEHIFLHRFREGLVVAGRKDRAYPSKQVFREFPERLLGSGNHFRHQEAGQNPVLFRHVPLDRHARTFFSTHQDLSLGQEFREIFESHGGFPDAQAVPVCHAIDEVRGGDGSSHVSGPTSGRRQIIHQ